MKTLLQINTTANSGSHGRIAEELGKMVISHGWRSIIAYGRWANKSASELIKIGNKADTICHWVTSSLCDKHGLGSVNATKKLIQNIQEIKPDIIHLHNLHGYYLNYELLLEYIGESKIPTILTLHDCWTMTGHCSHFENLGCQKWKSLCQNCPSIKTNDYPKSFFYENSKKNFLLKKEIFSKLDNLTIVPVCNWLDNIVAQSFLSSHKRKVILNGIDLNTFKEHKSRNSIDSRFGTKGKFIGLAVGSNWKDTKSLNDILNIRKSFGDDTVFIIIGLDKSQIKNLPQGIIGIEHTENTDELVDFYNAADVLIKPTYRDTLPTVDIEAIACGTPVVTYDTGGTKEIISEKFNNGFVVKRGDATNMAYFINEIKKNHPFEKAVCRNIAENLFDRNRMLNDYKNLYKSTLLKHENFYNNCCI